MRRVIHRRFSGKKTTPLLDTKQGHPYSGGLSSGPRDPSTSGLKTEIIRGRGHHETHIPTQHHQAQAHPRVSCPDGDESGPAGAEKASRQRPCKIDPIADEYQISACQRPSAAKTVHTRNTRGWSARLIFPGYSRTTNARWTRCLRSWAKITILAMPGWVWLFP